MKVGKKSIKTSSCRIIHFKSKEKMNNWEKMAQAIKHGFRPRRNK